MTQVTQGDTDMHKVSLNTPHVATVCKVVSPVSPVSPPDAVITIGDCVNCLDGGGCVVTAAPLVVVDVRAHTDGQLYCFFIGQSAGWPASQCELVTGDFEVEL